MVASVVSGLPSTIWAWAKGRDLLEATVAAGTILRPGGDQPGPLVAAALPTHLAISAFWGVVLARALPRDRGVAPGAIAGLAIGALDLLVVGRAFPRIKELPIGPQLADHVAFGLTVAALLPSSPPTDAP